MYCFWIYQSFYIWFLQSFYTFFTLHLQPANYRAAKKSIVHTTAQCSGSWDKYEKFFLHTLKILLICFSFHWEADSSSLSWCSLTLDKQIWAVIHLYTLGGVVLNWRWWDVSLAFFRFKLHLHLQASLEMNTCSLNKNPLSFFSFSFFFPEQLERTNLWSRRVTTADETFIQLFFSTVSFLSADNFSLATSHGR